MSDSAARRAKASAPTTAHNLGQRLPGQRPFVLQPKSESDRRSPSPDQMLQMQQLDAGVMQTLGLQAKLAIGESGDKYEQEADQVAAQVVEQISAPQTQQKSVQRQGESENDNEEIQMKSLADSIQRQEIPTRKNREVQMKSFVQRQSDEEGDAPAHVESAIESARGHGPG